VALRIENAIDLHCHFGPDTIGQTGGRAARPLIAAEIGEHGHSVTGYEAAREAFESGHRAIVLKSHSFCSAQLAENLCQAVPGMTVFGGTCTDYASGGLSVALVESALLLGSRIVWLPTVNSCQDHAHAPDRFPGRAGIAVIGEDGAPTQVVRDIAALCRDFDAVLATGHTTAAEHHTVVSAFAREGKVLVTHAGEALAGPNLSAAQAKELADLGATIELTAECCVPVFDRPPKSAGTMAEMIGTIGHHRCTLSSDYGWSNVVPRPAPGFKEFLERLWDVGVGETELIRMAATNPAALLCLQ
jgi:hypothetical protein